MSMEKLRLKYPVIVEGRYDKIKLSSVVEGTVITTDGFAVFKNTERLALIRRLAEKTPIILLTDSDGGGKVIRSHICSAVRPERLIQLYIPQIKGKERRKSAESAEGFLGVEGMDAALLRELLLPFSYDGAAESAGDGSLGCSEECEVRRAEITKADLYEYGLTGGQNSSARRDSLCGLLGLPRGMTSGALLEALRILCTREEFINLAKKL